MLSKKPVNEIFHLDKLIKKSWYNYFLPVSTHFPDNIS